jgi:hypothetical protein
MEVLNLQQQLQIGFFVQQYPEETLTKIPHDILPKILKCLYLQSSTTSAIAKVSSYIIIIINIDKMSTYFFCVLQLRVLAAQKVEKFNTLLLL